VTKNDKKARRDMKNSTRHQLKDNELAQAVGGAVEFLGSRSSQVLKWGGGLIALAVVAFGVTTYLQRSNGRADALLAEAMVALNARVVPPTATDAAEGGVPAAATLGAVGSFASEAEKLTAALPKLQAAADAYPDSSAGITARYHLAGALASLGRLPEAEKAFDDVARRAGDDSLYGRMARLGQADVQTRAGQADGAITALKTLAAGGADSELPADAVLMELGRAYVAKGSTEDARKTFTQLLEQHPDSPYISDARAQLDTLKGA
jgi:TolA-binding protein